jgi:hypothetical protein
MSLLQMGQAQRKAFGASWGPTAWSSSAVDLPGLEIAEACTEARVRPRARTVLAARIQESVAEIWPGPVPGGLAAAIQDEAEPLRMGEAWRAPPLAGGMRLTTRSGDTATSRSRAWSSSSMP